MSVNMKHASNIAKGVVESIDFNGLEWAEVSVVFQVDDEGFVTNTYGYSYDDDGKPTAIAPDIDNVEEPVRAYREWLRQEGDKGFTRMLFQFNRNTLKVKADFEYDNVARWKVTPANIDTITEELRPRLGE
ncbi:hypothetical protein [Mesorhizobium sp. CAU 1732]|uniref:hypothetical protein n=1 Tax=Mesorhizobium sp. CAU 1732 TaxID=3140358 RepID=UPI003261C81B